MFENEHTLENFLVKKGEGAFHDMFEQAIALIRSEFGKNYTMIIDGEEVKAQETFAHTSPIDTRIVLGQLPRGSAKHVRHAVRAAKNAFESWGMVHHSERVRVCRRAADAIVDHKFELAAWISFENGKNRYEAIGDVDEAIDFIRYYAEEIERNNGFELITKSAHPNEKSKSVMKPFGVWGVIAPFNFPAAILVGMTTAAIITGNTAILKPASDAPILAFKFAEIMKRAGLPNGVLNLVIGTGRKVGQALVDSNDLAGIVFTGSRDVGYSIARQFSRSKPRTVIAELGGKNPTIVTETADLGNAVDGVMKAAFGYSGQKCSACSRVYVHRDVKKAFVQNLIEKTRNLPVGNPLDPNVFVGPLINASAYRNYQSDVRLASKSKTGKILTGGSIKKEGEFKHGYYVEPTIIDGLPMNHKLLREELFVPILCIAAYVEFDDVLRLCNSSQYGLTAGIFSNNRDEIRKFLDGIEAGVTYVNRAASATTGAMVGCQPFGGWKGSGTTGKGTGGPYYLMQFMREQSQTVVE